VLVGDSSDDFSLDGDRLGDFSLDRLFRRKPGT
jgi:hypothetical protein